MIDTLLIVGMLFLLFQPVLALAVCNTGGRLRGLGLRPYPGLLWFGR